MKFCPNCGKKIIEGADVCIGCGKFLNKKPAKVEVNEKPFNKGFGITSMVFGIVSIIWSLSMLLSIDMGIEELKVEMYYNGGLIYMLLYFIGYTLFSLTPAILGMIFGIKQVKKEKTGFATSGLIMSFISLVACLFVFVCFLTIAIMG